MLPLPEHRKISMHRNDRDLFYSKKENSRKLDIENSIRETQGLKGHVFLSMPQLYNETYLQAQNKKGLVDLPKWARIAFLHISYYNPDAYLKVPYIGQTFMDNLKEDFNNMMYTEDYYPVFADPQLYKSDDGKYDSIHKIVPYRKTAQHIYQKISYHILIGKIKPVDGSNDMSEIRELMYQLGCKIESMDEGSKKIAKSYLYGHMNELCGL